jgi:hypothetical protein
MAGDFKKGMLYLIYSIFLPLKIGKQWLYIGLAINVRKAAANYGYLNKEGETVYTFDSHYRAIW